MEVFRIFLSSPGDVADERGMARQVLNSLGKEPQFRGQLALEEISWDDPATPVPMDAHLPPQEAINQGRPKPSQCDIVVVILWKRMGTPLKEHVDQPEEMRFWSGTAWECFDALDAADAKARGEREHAPRVLIYRRTEEPHIGMRDPRRNEKLGQFDRVESFFESFRSPEGSLRRSFHDFETSSAFASLLEKHLREVVWQRLKPAGRTKASTAQWSVSPYPGLRPFTADEAPFFFGRSRETDDLIRMVTEGQFVAVVGSSGSGKSSLIYAGLLPRLHARSRQGKEHWDCMRFTPAELDNNPFLALSIAFKPILQKHGRALRKLAEDLETNPDMFRDLAAMALEGKPDWAELLLFIDQFEELFTLVDSKYQHDFVDLISLAANTERVHTVLTMRADFYHRCLEWAELAELLKTGSYPLPSPGIGSLNEMITRPAKRAGLQFEQGLVERILNDTGTKPGAIALMAFALFELWNKSRKADGVLSHAAYESYNGVYGAIGERAEDTFNGLIEGNEGKRSVYENALASVFRELVEVDDRGVPTRRRTRLIKVTDEMDAETLVDALTEARLLVKGTGEDNEPVVEVAHEAIFTNWPRLEDWIEVRRDDLRLLRQVRLAATEWVERRRDEHFLWPHGRLLLVSQMLDRMHPALNPTEKEFVRPESERILEEIHNASTTHQQRVKIGDRLAEIGDCRPVVDLREDGLPDIAWCEVPAGEITFKDRVGTFTVEPFYIGKYPVTWIQYRSFLEAKDGYQNKQWWKGLAERKDQPGKQYREFDNHPAENVSWYDAVAFCRWLTKRLGYEIRLPTEWEWQQAATGGDAANEYPWGAEWDSSRANTLESGLSRTTAVGLYPRGVTSVGALDMSGNVFEWCLNEWEKPDRIDVTGEASRAVRGGCWYFNPDFARCAFRFNDYPNDRSYFFGFRLLCWSPIL